MMRPLELQRRSRSSRLIAALLLVLQAVVLVALPLTDGRAEARSASATAHVEDTTSAACVPAHAHSACLVCRTLRTFGPTTDASSLLTPTTGLHAPATHRGVDAELGAVTAPIRSRAPPAR
jgi:hypothetical protein